MDADNDLEYGAITDFYELAEVGSTADVNVVVQLDRVAGYSDSDGNWTDCKRFYVTPGMTPTSENAVVSLGEVNMGNPQSLEDFINWTMGQHPAEKYTLILWNHGWLTGIGGDSSNGWDWLTAYEIYEILNQVVLTTGNQIDIVGFDACFGASIEMAYHVSGGAGIMVASEEVTSSLAGYPYDDILAELVASPTMNATEFAMVIHNQFVLRNEGFGEEIHTFSVLNTTTIADELAPAVNTLAGHLNSLLPTYYYDVLGVIIRTATGFTNPTWRDLYDFCQVLTARIPDEEIVDAAQNVMDTLLNACIAEWHDVNSPRLHGLSIYLPPSDDNYLNWYDGDALQWANDTVWDEFLEALFVTYYPGTLTQESFDEVSYTLLDSDSDDWLDTVQVHVDADTTGASCEVSVFGQLINSTGSTIDTNNASWTILGYEEEWGNLNLSVPQGTEGDWYDVELFLHDDYGILEDHHYLTNCTFLPLIMQHDVTVNELSFRSRIVGQGYPAQINVTICNTGHYTEVVNVTTNANGTILNTTQLILSSGNLTSFNISWETVTEDLGNYTITSLVQPVAGEVNIDDNTLTGSVLITIPGDVDGDKDVDIFDIVTMADIYGTSQHDPDFNPDCDIDGDLDIDIFDIVIAAGHYGESW